MVWCPTPQYSEHASSKLPVLVGVNQSPVTMPGTASILTRK